jgi:hypothetical protein
MGSQSESNPWVTQAKSCQEHSRLVFIVERLPDSSDRRSRRRALQDTQNRHAIHNVSPRL